MALLAAVVAGAAVSTLFVAVMRPPGIDVLRARMQRLWAPEAERVQGDPFSARVLKPMGEAVMRSASRLLPQSLPEALDELRQDEVVQEALGPIYDEFIKIKEAEWKEYHRQVSQWELDRYLTMF